MGAEDGNGGQQVLATSAEELRLVQNGKDEQSEQAVTEDKRWHTQQTQN